MLASATLVDIGVSNVSLSGVFLVLFNRVQHPTLTWRYCGRTLWALLWQDAFGGDRQAEQRLQAAQLLVSMASRRSARPLWPLSNMICVPRLQMHSQSH